MPTYEYVCTECGHTFEQFQSFTDDALRHCPECDGRLRKLFNAVGVVFKGSGFYRTDSRSDAAAGGKGQSCERHVGHRVRQYVRQRVGQHVGRGGQGIVGREKRILEVREDLLAGLQTLEGPVLIGVFVGLFVRLSRALLRACG